MGSRTVNVLSLVRRSSFHENEYFFLSFYWSVRQENLEIHFLIGPSGPLII